MRLHRYTLRHAVGGGDLAMFEIGSSLREARERRGLSYGQVEAETAIRTRYIRALEDEDFHILPGPTYTKGFLRAYAEYLGLDGQPFVDEFNSRHHDPRGGGRAHADRVAATVAAAAAARSGASRT